MNKLVLLAIALCLVFAWGCSKKVKTTPEVVVVEDTKVVKKTPPPPTPMEIYMKDYAALPTSHTVTKGECLWWISEYKHVYNDPFMWPLIYKANRGEIKNPDLIYPGQTFDVPRQGFSVEDVAAARKMAGAPWKDLNPGAGAMIPAEMRSALGYSF